jgi:hypothetical protein
MLRIVHRTGHLPVAAWMLAAPVATCMTLACEDG